jgi:hypothetical protein
MIRNLFSDIHGNLSSKRVLGGIGWMVGLGRATCSGFHWYSVDVAAYATVLTASSGLLVATGFERKPASPADSPSPTPDPQ